MNQRNTQCQNIAELTNAILEELRRFPKERLHRNEYASAGTFA